PTSSSTGGRPRAASWRLRSTSSTSGRNTSGRSTSRGGAARRDDGSASGGALLRLRGQAQRPLDQVAQAAHERVAVRLHAAGDPVGQQHLVHRAEQLGQVARLLLDEFPGRDAAAEDVRLQRVDVLPVAILLRRPDGGAETPRSSRAQVHTEKRGMVNEVFDVHLNQREQRLARAKVARRDPASEPQQLLSAFLQQGGVQLGLAGKDGVDGPHGESAVVRDLDHLGSVVAALGKDPFGGLEDVLAIDAVARRPRLVARLLPWHGIAYHPRAELTSHISEW